MPSTSIALQQDEAGSTTSSKMSKRTHFKLKRAANLLTSSGKPISELRDLVHEEHVEAEEHEKLHSQSMLVRRSSQLGKKLKQKWRELKSGSQTQTAADDKEIEENAAADDEEVIPGTPSSNWIRRTSLNLTRSLSRTGTSSSASSFQVISRPVRHTRAASESLPSRPRPSLSLNRTTSSSSTAGGSTPRRPSLKRAGTDEKIGDSLYQPTALEGIVQSPVDVEHGPRPFDDNKPEKSTPQLTQSISTDSTSSSYLLQDLQSGTPLTKITAKKRQTVFVRVDLDQGHIIWESKPGVLKFIPVESIREIRTGQSAAFHLTQFNLSQSYLPLWVTIVYTASGCFSTLVPEGESTSGLLSVWPPNSTTRTTPLLSSISLASLNAMSPKLLGGSNGFSYSGATFKSLHLLCPSIESQRVLEQTLKGMLTKLKDGLGFGMEAATTGREMEMWEKREFNGADTTPDSRLSFSEVAKMCWKLNIRMNEVELKRLFTSADVSNRGYLDFNDFRHFVKLLKARPELERLYRTLVAKAAEKRKDKKEKGREKGSENLMTVDIFVDFMRNKQESTLPDAELEVIFIKYSQPLSSYTPASPPMKSLSLPSVQSTPVMLPEKEMSMPLPSPPLTLPTPPPSTSPSPDPNASDYLARKFTAQTQEGHVAEPETRVMTSSHFASFLSSNDNPSLLEQPAVEEHTFGLGSLSLHHHGFEKHKHGHFHLPHLHFHKDKEHSAPPTPPPERIQKQAQPLSVMSQDMTRPLTEYYISSSHNTYLIGHQLVGESTVEGYVRALIGGCRSVEIDIYDGEHDTPMIYHGHTLTSKLSLREVCEAIMTYGFMESQFPIIISAEVHLSVLGQSQMARIMREVFGERLVTREREWEKWKLSTGFTGDPLEDDNGIEDADLRAMTSWKIEELPSPEDLKGRILLKTKNLSLAHGQKTPDLNGPPSSWTPPSGGPLDVTTSSTSDTDNGAMFSDLEHKARTILQRVRSTRGKSPAHDGGGSSPPTSSFLSRRGSSNAQSALTTTPTGTPTSSPQKPKKDKDGKQKKEKIKMSPHLIPLLVYTVGVKCRGINKKEIYAPEEMFSLSEKRAQTMLKSGAALDVIKHTRSHLVRIYPKGMRLSSSNYEPHRFWAIGTQLVALNWQTFDTGYTINHAMFQRNGRTGYVLKPLALRMAHSQKEVLSQLTQHYLDVTVISAQHLPRKESDKEGKKDSSKKEGKDTGVDPFVEVSLHLPDWNYLVASCTSGSSFASKPSLSPPASPPTLGRSPSSGSSSNGNPTTIAFRTGIVKNNGFNPIWEEKIRIPYNCVGEPQSGMKDLIFVKFTIKAQSRGDREEETLAVFCASLGCLQPGYRHLPLYDAQMSQYLYSTLFVRIQHGHS